MPYKYVANDKDGNPTKGMLDAPNQEAAEDALTKGGYTSVSLQKVRPRPKLEDIFPSLYGVKTEDVTNFSRQLATLLEAGLTLPQALQLLEAQVERAAFRKVISSLRTDLESGSSFSDALAKHPAAFNNIYVHMSTAGEHSGDLAEALRQAVNYIERGQVAIKKVKRALTYPSVILVVALMVVLLLVTYVLPELLKMFDTMDIELPLPTKILKAISDTAGEHGLFIMAGFVAFIIALVLFVRTPAGTKLKDRLLLRAPLLSSIVLMSNMALFSRTGSTLMSSGVPLPRIMDIVVQVTPNVVVRNALIEVQEGLLQGHGLAKPMAMNSIFPPLMVQMMTVGEQTGTLDSSMQNVATFYESEVSGKLEALTSIIEPIIVTGIAVVVGFIAVSVIMPMYTVLGSVSG